MRKGRFLRSAATFAAALSSIISPAPAQRTRPAASAFPADDGQRTMPAKDYASTRYGVPLGEAQP